MGGLQDRLYGIRTYPLNTLAVCSGRVNRQAWYLRSMATTVMDLLGSVPNTDVVCGTAECITSSSLGIRTCTMKSNSPWTSPDSSNRSNRNTSWSITGRGAAKPK